MLIKEIIRNVYFRRSKVATLVKQQTPSIMSFFHVQTLLLLIFIIPKNKSTRYTFYPKKNKSLLKIYNVVLSVTSLSRFISTLFIHTFSAKI